jgi:methionyl-tRNA synthetase
MSKTNLTGIHPFQLLDVFGVDAYRWFFIREVQYGQDGNFSWEAMVDRTNSDLANGLGNLASRVLAMLGSYFDGVVPAPGDGSEASDLPELTADAVRRYDEHMLAVRLTAGLGAVWDVIARANRYLVEKEPWKLAKDDAKRDELAGILYAAAETLRILAVLIQPIMPSAAQRLWDQLGVGGAVENRRVPVDAAWGMLEPGTATTKGESLFPRVEAE